MEIMYGMSLLRVNDCYSTDKLTNLIYAHR